jgi:hypothetical protein
VNAITSQVASANLVFRLAPVLPILLNWQFLTADVAIVLLKSPPRRQVVNEAKNKGIVGPIMSTIAWKDLWCSS